MTTDEPEMEHEGSVCHCGLSVRVEGWVPEREEWRLLSAVELEGSERPLAAETLASRAVRLSRCPRCETVSIFWLGTADKASVLVRVPVGNEPVCRCGRGFSAAHEWPALPATDLKLFRTPVDLDALLDETTSLWRCPDCGSVAVVWDTSRDLAVYEPFPEETERVTVIGKASPGGGSPDTWIQLTFESEGPAEVVERDGVVQPLLVSGQIDVVLEEIDEALSREVGHELRAPRIVVDAAEWDEGSSSELRSAVRDAVLEGMEELGRARVHWYRECPACGDGGGGVLGLFEDMKAERLFLWCDECEASWGDPGGVGDFDRSYPVPERPSVRRADWRRIRRYGWEEIAVHFGASGWRRFERERVWVPIW